MSRSINILHVVAGMNRGGAETFLMNILRTIDRDNYKFIFLCYGDATFDFENEINNLGGELVRVKDVKDVGIAEHLKDIRKIIKKYKIDVVHAHTYYNSMFALIAGYMMGVKTRIVHSHNTRSESRPSLKKRAYFAISNLMIRIFATEFLACGVDAGRALFGKTKSFTVIPNGINVNQFKFKSSRRKEVRDELRIEDNVTVILHAGRFEEQKNHEYLIDIFRRYYKLNRNSVLILVGRGPLEDDIKILVDDYGLKDHVYFLGVRSDMANLYSAADFFVFPSLFEGLPVVLVEAQASSLSCIVSDTIDRAIDITGLVSFASIASGGADKWAKHIHENTLLSKNRVLISSLGEYDVNESTKLLTPFYGSNND